MPRIAVVHRKPEEAKPLLAKLGDGAKVVDFPQLRKFGPDAVVISLARLPSYGRAVGKILRIQKWSRAIPLIFADGEPDKVELVRRELPDAIYTTTTKVASALKSAFKNAPLDPVVPERNWQWTKSLPDKLGLKPEMSVALGGGDVPDIERIVGSVSEQIRWTERPGRTTHLAMLFIRSQQEAADGIGDLIGPWPLWIFWPKRSSRISTDVTPMALRDLCNFHNLVDSKILSLNSTWSGMLFTRRKR